MKYKMSIFTARVVVNSHIYLYSTFTDQITALSTDVDELLEKYRLNIQDLKYIHPDLFNCLLHHKYIVSNDCEEWKEVYSTWEKEDNSPLKFSMIINPTLNCNMRCWYCYEHHDKSAYMSEETIQLVKRLITKKVEEKALKGLNIDFFGGEPLLHYKKCVKPILDTAYAECDKLDKRLYVSFTTNAFLLSDAIVRDLDKYAKWGQIRMQITLDGNEALHDKTRTLNGIYPTYRKIISNIVNCVRNNISVLVRLNYTNENVDSFYDIMDEFTSLTLKEKGDIIFTMHKVWQEINTPDLDNRVEMLKAAFQERGFFVEFTEPLNGSRCYGDRENFIVINYNGDLYKCTAREFLPSGREGVLAQDGNIDWNAKYQQRMSLKKCPPVCHSCVLFPLCHAGCTQNKLEIPLNEGECLRRYTEEQKKMLLERKIEYRLKLRPSL